MGLDSKGNSDNSDFLIGEIEESEKRVDELSQSIEAKKKEIEELQEKIGSIAEKLATMPGDLLAIAQREISARIDSKHLEIVEYTTELESVQQDVKGKFDEVERGIEERADLTAELEAAEEECDVDLSDSKQASNDEASKFEDAKSKLNSIKDKIGAALTLVSTISVGTGGILNPAEVKSDIHRISSIGSAYKGYEKARISERDRRKKAEDEVFEASRKDQTTN